MCSPFAGGASVREAGAPRLAAGGRAAPLRGGKVVPWRRERSRTVAMLGIARRLPHLEHRAEADKRDLVGDLGVFLQIVPAE